MSSAAPRILAPPTCSTWTPRACRCTSAWRLVVGATAPTEMADLRGSSELPFLIPGIGAQGGDLEGSVRAAWNGDPASCLVSASRSVLFAEKPSQEAAKAKDAINAVVGALR